MSKSKYSVWDRFCALRDGVPFGTQVDPVLFPEEEYPVNCLECGYLLRGLPDGRCPECGEAFARGFLLVEQYVRNKRARNDKFLRITKILSMIVIVCMAPFLLPLAFWCIAYLIAPNFTAAIIPEYDLDSWVMVLWGLSFVGLLVMIVSAYLRLKTMPPHEKRKAVIEAVRNQ